jgi:hypothetical protein
MKRSSQHRAFAGAAAKSSAFLVVLFLLSSCAPKGLVPPFDRPRSIGCRIVSISSSSPKRITPLTDVSLDTADNDPPEQTFSAVIHDGRNIAASVRRVHVTLPRDRFNVVMTLDGRTLLRANHMDLDIYIETTIDEHVYALHCFPDIVVIEEVPSEP